MASEAQPKGWIMSKKARLIVVLIIAVIIFLFLPGCPKINRLLFINQKINDAKEKLDNLDEQMAQAHNFSVYEVGTQIYEFDHAGGELKTLINYPKNKTEKSPVIIFSHGLGGSGESQLYLTEGLARRGNIVIAPDHVDAINYDRIGLLTNNRRSATAFVRGISFVILTMIKDGSVDNHEFVQLINSLTPEELAAEAISGELRNSFEQFFSYRIADIDSILSQLDYLNQTDEELQGQLDLNNLIFGGHSLGGATGLFIATSNNNPFKAMFLLSPATMPFSRTQLQKIVVPVLYLTGDLDAYYDSIRRAYENSPAPKFFQSTKDGGHIIFTDRYFLYGAGLPFLSEGQTGFSTDLPYDQETESGSKKLINDYPEQLQNFQAKALTIVKAVSAFVDFYANGNQSRLILLESSINDDFTAEFKSEIPQPQENEGA